MVTETRHRAPGFFGDEERSASSDVRESLLRFLAARYWRSWIFIGWLKLAALLPWRRSLALHQRLGRWLGSKSHKSTRLVHDNLKRCFPDMTEAERDHLMATRGMNQSYFEECPSCKRERTAVKLAGVVLATHPDFEPKQLGSVAPPPTPMTVRGVRP